MTLRFDIGKDENGFTLIEVLLVVVVVGVLAGISIGVISPDQQKNRVEDGVRMRNIKAVAEGLESYNQLEQNYPPNDSIGDSNSLLHRAYLDDWPGDNYKYDNTGGDFVLEVANSTQGCYKYQSDWAQVMECPAAECALLPSESVSVSNSSDCSQL